MASTARYASFMLRLNWALDEDTPTWVASLQDAKTGELRWFPSLNELVVFLREEFANPEEIWDASQPAEQHSSPGPQQLNHTRIHHNRNDAGEQSSI